MSDAKDDEAWGNAVTKPLHATITRLRTERDEALRELDSLQRQFQIDGKRLTDERDALAAAMPSEGADAALACAVAESALADMWAGAEIASKALLDMTRERDGWQSRAEGWKNDAGDARLEVEQLRAEIVRLNNPKVKSGKASGMLRKTIKAQSDEIAALRTACHKFCNFMHSGELSKENMVRVYDLARAALSGRPQEKT